jgi:TonB family protein
MIMKTKNAFILPARLKLILVLPIILLVLVTVYSCASGKKSVTAKTEVAPPPPPPPPPPVPQSAKSRDNVKIVEENSNDEFGETPFVVVEEMPMFPGGDSALLSFIAMNTKYPENAKANGIQGRVIIRFCVTKVGGVDRISVLKGVDPELDAESVRVVGSLPAFKPGKQGGKIVPVWYMVPISFALSGTKPSTVTPPPPPAPPADVSSTDKVYTEVDELPVFKGGDANLLKYIAENTKYPEEAKKNKITGKVIVKLVVEKDCSVSNVGILESVNALLDAEAVRVVSTLPKFETPGKKAGESVRVNYMIPITFTLK